MEEIVYQKKQSGFKKCVARLNSCKQSIGKRPWLVLIILGAVMVLLIALFLFVGMGNHASHALGIRIPTVIAILIISVCVGYSTVVFQTVTNARILTPGVLGFENIYMFLNTLLVFLFYGASGFLFNSVEGNFILSFFVMMGFSLLIFMPLLTKGSKGIYILLLVGIILSTLFASLTSFMQFLIDPERFMTIQARMFASFSAPDNLLMIIAAGIIVVSLVLAPSAKKLDVISLGRENAISLGVSHKFACLKILIIVAALVSVSTVIAGPVMFLGLISANLAYQFIKTFKHRFVIPAAILISAIALFAAEFFIREVVAIDINVAVVINFFGGIYFIFLLMRERKKEK